MAIKGLIFDFDGLILDTETPEFEVWQEIFQTYGAALTLEQWQPALGASFAAFDPVTYLSELLGGPLDHAAIHTDHRQKSLQRILLRSPQPGVTETIREAQRISLKLGIASSSPVSWVHSLLHHLNLFESFEQIACSDHVKHIKPDPELFNLCCSLLDLEKDQVIIFEDSPNGIRAANAAGIFCVAVENTLTRQLDTSHADLCLTRIDEIPLLELLSLAESRITSR